MPNISEIKKSNYLKKEDCGRGILLTIESCIEENVAKEGAPEEFKWILHFEGQEKGMVLNSTNAQLIAQFIGSPETDQWVGHKVVLYNDPSISFQGKLTGGIRARAPRNQPAQPAQPAAPARPQPAARQPAPLAPPVAPENYEEPPFDSESDVPF